MGEARPSVRVTTSVSAEIAEKLEAIAHAQKHSKSWVVARAVEKYLESSSSVSDKQNRARRGQSA